jgi:hypothetical protein
MFCLCFLFLSFGTFAQSPRHQGTRARQDNDPTVSVDMVDGVNESVISATERIVIQQQSNNLKVYSSFPFLSLCLFSISLLCHYVLTSKQQCIFIIRSYFSVLVRTCCYSYPISYPILYPIYI